MYRFRLQSGRARFVVLAVLCVLAGASLAAAADRALIVGIGNFKYAGPDIPNLPGIDLDVNLMQEVADLLGFEEIRTLTDTDATYDGFVREFEQWLIEGTRDGDRVLVYVSSHGSYTPDDNGDESDGRDEILILHDTRARDKKWETFLRDDDFNTLLRRVPSRDVLVLIDACNSGTAYKAIRLGNASLGEREAYTKFVDYPGIPVNYGGRADEAAVDKGVGVAGRAVNFAFLAAAADEELAVATGAGSVFTLGLREVIKKAAHARQVLTVKDLQRGVASYIESKLSPEKVHRPQLGGNSNLLEKSLRLVVPSQGGRIWRQLEALAGRGTALSIKANRSDYRLDEEVIFTIDVPHAGYLNVVSVDSQDEAAVLFPNKHHSNNRVQEGLFTLPTDHMDFYFYARKPTGDNLTVAFLTKRKMDLYEDAVEGRNAKGELTVDFALLSAKAIQRGVGVASRQDPSYAAGKLIFQVTD